MKQKKPFNFAVYYPKLAAMWDPIMNEGIRPEDISQDSDMEIWWLCANGHSWVDTVQSMSQIKGCPYCSGKMAHPENNLLIHNQDLACLWHPDKNGDLSPDMVLPTSTETVWWHCPGGHEWQASVVSMTIVPYCPICINELEADAWR